MREIKFRAWNKNNDEMVYSFDYPYYWNIGDLGLELLESDGTDYLRQEAVFMQSTGLLDKNDTEIYEGDILKRDDFSDEPPQYVVRFGKFMDSHDMYYRQEYFGWYVDEIGKQDEYRNPLTYIVNMLEGVLCGNIYEHPHLLRGDNA